MRAAIATGEEQALRFQRRLEALAAVRRRPAGLDGFFQRLRIAAHALALLPVGKIEAAPVALLLVKEAARQLPAVFEVKTLGDGLELALKMWQRAGRHGFCVDARPDGMGVSPALFLVQDDDAGLAGQTGIPFDPVNGALERADRN